MASSRMACRPMPASLRKAPRPPRPPTRSPQLWSTISSAWKRDTTHSMRTRMAKCRSRTCLLRLNSWRSRSHTRTARAFLKSFQAVKATSSERRGCRRWPVQTRRVCWRPGGLTQTHLPPQCHQPWRLATSRPPDHHLEKILGCSTPLMPSLLRWPITHLALTTATTHLTKTKMADCR